MTGCKNIDQPLWILLVHDPSHMAEEQFLFHFQKSAHLSAHLGVVIVFVRINGIGHKKYLFFFHDLPAEHKGSCLG